MNKLQLLSCMFVTSIVDICNAVTTTREADDIIIQVQPEVTKKDVEDIIANYPRFNIGKRFDLRGHTIFELVLDKSKGKSTISEDDPDIIAIRNNKKVARLTIDYKQLIKPRSTARNIPVKKNELELSWYLKGNHPGYSMNIDKAWGMGYTGKGVVVGVIDSQIQMSHLDLANIDVNNSAMYVNVTLTDEDLENFGVSHGTFVSGIIGATKGNDFCIAGVAYGVSIQGIGLLNPSSNAGTAVTIKLGALIHNLDMVDIYCNSYGVDSNANFIKVETDEYNAIVEGAETGRDGKGSIYVFAAGNLGSSANSAAEGILNLIYTIPIGSVGFDRSTDYNQIGSNIMAVGQGGFEYDMTIASTIPYNKCKETTYDNSQVGTSYSAPQVVGIIALALEANEKLTWRDVQHLIVRTSKAYCLKDTYPPQYQWRRNGRGLKYHPKMGFGLVDAFDMVNLAKVWRTVPEMLYCNFTADFVNRTGTDREPLVGTLLISRYDCPIRYLENVHVNVELKYALNRGFTEIDVISPMGTRSPLLTARPADNKEENNGPNYIEWTFRSVHFWDENPAGEWTLLARSISSVVDKVGPVDWGLQLYGTP